MQKRIYVCHTYYHVSVSMLKEFALPKEEQGHATLILSKMSNDFESLKERLLPLGVFEEILDYDEKFFKGIPELEKYHVKEDNFVKALINRIIFTKKYAKYQEPYIPVDFKKYDQIYVFCDSDPIGYYLNYKHIYYHSVEDGLDTLRTFDWARQDNSPHFEIKAFLSKKLNLIFIQNGYGKYCLDMEINNKSILKFDCPYHVEVPRNELMARLTRDEKQIFLSAFVKDKEKIEKIFSNSDRKTLLLLTEPLCKDMKVREQLFRDLINEYKDEYEIIIKQHPRDELDYAGLFPDYLLVDRTVPMEMLNYFDNLHVNMVLSVYTELGSIHFADEKKRLGIEFMDKYEDKSEHDSKFKSE